MHNSLDDFVQRATLDSINSSFSTIQAVLSNAKIHHSGTFFKYFCLIKCINEALTSGISIAGDILAFPLKSIASIIYMKF